jgi:hypothetical protein
MKRVDDMSARLPPLYREGERVRQILDLPGVQIEVLDEHATRVQRAHWFNETFELEEAAALAALLDFTAEPWQTLDLFRAWVHAQRDATLIEGAVTVDGIERFLAEYTRGFEDATDIAFENRPAELVECPRRRRYAAAPAVGGLAPLSRFSVEMKGLDETVASMLLTGLSTGPESIPVIVNLTTGDGLVFFGNVPQGQRLWLQAHHDGGVAARLERTDVTSQLRSLTGLVPGTVWNASQLHGPPRALPLTRGTNELWFFTAAHFDALGLDRFLLGLADLALKQGRWEETQFDHALFYQDPAVQLRMTWVETEPASIQVRLPLGVAVRRATAPGRAENDRAQFAASVGAGVARLRAAGVRDEVLELSFSETQATTEFLTGMHPVTIREAGATGGERMPDKGGVFGVTGFGDSTYR